MESTVSTKISAVQDGIENTRKQIKTVVKQFKKIQSCTSKQNAEPTVQTIKTKKRHRK